MNKPVDMRGMVPVRQYANADELMSDYRARHRQTMAKRKEVIERVVADLVPAPAYPIDFAAVERIAAEEADKAWKAALDRAIRTAMDRYAGELTSAMTSLPKHTMQSLLQSVVDATGITKTAIFSIRRDPESVRGRHILMWLAKRYLPLSLPLIGRHVGGRDHTTVLHAVRKISDIVKANGIKPRSDTPEAWAREIYAVMSA